MIGYLPAVSRRAPGLVLAGLALPCTVFCPAASAQTLDQDVWISAQAYYPRVDTNVRVAANVEQTIGTDIDLESDLQLDKRDLLPAVSIGSRFGRVVVGFDFFKLKRDGTAMIQRDIAFDDVVYPVDAEVESGFDSDVFRLTVGYSFVRTENLELGAALGVHATDFKVQLAGEAVGSDQAVTVRSRSKKVFAPLPTLGVYSTWRVAPRVHLNGRVDYLSLKIDDYDGELVNAQLGVNYAIVDNIAVGVAYRYVDYRLGVDKTDWDGRVKYRLAGPALVLSAAF